MLATDNKDYFDPMGVRSWCSITNHVSCIVSTMIRKSKKPDKPTIYIAKDGKGYKTLSYNKKYTKPDQRVAHKRLAEGMQSHMYTSQANGMWTPKMREAANAYLKLHVEAFKRRYKKMA